MSVLYTVMKDDGFVSFRPDSTQPGTQSPIQTRIDSLSSRELEVIKLIASGLTNTEVGDELTVSAPHR